MQQDAARTFIAFYRGETIPHFREEEELLFPLLVDVTATVPDLLKQILVEHVQLHSMVRRLGMALETHSTEGALLIEVGVLLEAHIRREEGELFPLIEQVVLPAALAGLTLGARVRADPATLPPD
jgi:hemerythrin-like domain-containing protein